MPKIDQAKRVANLPPRGALKLHDARHYLGGISIPTMHRLIHRGLIKPNRVLRHLLFPVEELDRFLRAGQLIDRPNKDRSGQ